MKFNQWLLTNKTNILISLSMGVGLSLSLDSESAKLPINKALSLFVVGWMIFMVNYNFSFFYKWKEEKIGRSLIETKESKEGDLLLVWVGVVAIFLVLLNSWFHAMTFLGAQLVPVWYTRTSRSREKERGITTRIIIGMYALWLFIPVILFLVSTIYQ